MSMATATINYALTNPTNWRSTVNSYREIMALITKFCSYNGYTKLYFATPREALQHLGFLDDDFQNLLRQNQVLSGYSATITSCSNENCNTTFMDDISIGQWGEGLTKRVDWNLTRQGLTLPGNISRA